MSQEIKKERLIKKKLKKVVLPGLELVFTNFFLATKLLIKLDFPTFDLPKNTTCGRFNFLEGSFFKSGIL